MLRLFTSILLALTFSSASSSSRGLGAPLFGIRGGALFGNDDKKPSLDNDPIVSTKKYPPMTRQEVEDWLEHIPIFAVTDSKGAGVVLRPDNSTGVFYFFLNPLAANATLTQLKEVNNDMDLRVSAYSLGKIWFNLLNADPDQEVLLKAPDSNGDPQPTKDIEYRLVPDTRDLLGARMLLTISPEDTAKLQAGEGMTPEIAKQAVERAMTESPKFNATYNDIPVFTIAQMRMQKKAAEGSDEKPVTLLPMYFSLQNMVGTWQQFISKASPEMQGVEPAINLMSLHDLVELMQKESEIDFRHVVLVPPAPESEGQQPQATTSLAPADPMGGMGGATLGDL